MNPTNEPMSPPPSYFLPYAKTQRDTRRIHRLLYHLLDVGQVALVLWQRVLAPATRNGALPIINLLLAALTNSPDLIVGGSSAQRT